MHALFKYFILGNMIDSFKVSRNETHWDKITVLGKLGTENNAPRNTILCHHHVFVLLHSSIMAYRAGNPEDPSVLVQNISSSIQKLTLLSKTHTTHTIHRSLIVSWLQYVNDGRHVEIHQNSVCTLSSSLASELQRAVSTLGTEQDSSKLQQTLWVSGFWTIGLLYSTS